MRSSPILLAIFILSGCRTPAAPTLPSPFPTPTPNAVPSVQGIADATALENLDTVLRLERQRHASTVLVVLGGGSRELTGRIREGSWWRYVFSDREARKRYEWRVDNTGLIRFIGEIFSQESDSVRDLTPHLRVDSDHVLAAALSSGGNRYVSKHPAVRITMGVAFVGPIATWGVHFNALDNNVCEIDIFVSAETGAHLGNTNLACLDR